MAARKLRIVKRTPPALAVCEKCSGEFAGSDAEVGAAFDVHSCARLDSDQNALRVVREATGNG